MCFVTLYYLLFAKGRAISWVESPSLSCYAAERCAASSAFVGVGLQIKKKKGLCARQIVCGKLIVIPRLLTE